MQCRLPCAIFAILFGLLPIFRAVAGEDGGKGTYPINAGAVLDISVLGQPDLTRSYTVAGDNSISMHFIGPVTVSDLTPEEIRVTIEQRLFDKLNRSASVTVNVQSYRPVTVTGRVDRPGFVSFVPDQDVRQALALAGGLDRTGSDDSGLGMRVEETVGLRERLRQDIAARLAERSRITAELGKSEAVGTPPELVELVGADSAERLIALQQDVMQARAGRRVGFDANQGTKATLSREAAASYAEIQAVAQSRTRSSQDEYARIEELVSRGLTQRRELVTLGLQIGQSQSDALEAAAARTAALREARVDELESVEAAGALDEELHAGMAAVSSELRSLYVQYDAAGEFIERFGGADMLSRIGKRPVSYSIVRMTDAGRTRLPADEDSFLMPGDTLVVDLGAADR